MRRLVTPRAIVAAAVVGVYVMLVVRAVDRLGGIPATRELQVLLILGGFAAVSLTSVERVRRLVLGVLFDWLPFALLLALYDLIRGYADGLWLPARFALQIDVDKVFGLGAVPTVWLQQHLWHGPAHIAWYDYASWAAYMTYFFTPALLLAALWWRSRPAFRELAATMVLLAFMGLATFVLYPALPPWLAAERHLIPPVVRTVDLINPHVPVVSFQSLWHRGQEYANLVAAVPSLHAAYTLLVALYLVVRTRSRYRFLALLYPPAVAFSLVYSGEHYVTDVLLGWAYTLVAFAVVAWLPGLVRARRQGRLPAAADAAPAAD
jgi:membrane-associated phospholipid phosphatase